MAQEQDIKKIKNPFMDIEIFEDFEQYVKWEKLKDGIYKKKLLRISKNFENEFYEDTTKKKDKNAKFKNAANFIYCFEFDDKLNTTRKRLGCNSVRMYATLKKAAENSNEIKVMKDKKEFCCLLTRFGEGGETKYFATLNVEDYVKELKMKKEVDEIVDDKDLDEVEEVEDLNEDLNEEDFEDLV